jgi:hypothetical protein
VLDETHRFVFLVAGVPVRFFRGGAEEPTRRTLRRQETEAEQLTLALGDAGAAEGLKFRFAVETGDDGAVTRVVFLALRGEEGHVECSWPVPLAVDDELAPGPSARAAGRRHDAPALQLPVPAAAPRPPPRGVPTRAARRADADRPARPAMVRPTGWAGRAGTIAAAPRVLARPRPGPSSLTASRGPWEKGAPRTSRRRRKKGGASRRRRV